MKLSAESSDEDEVARRARGRRADEKLSSGRVKRHADERPAARRLGKCNADEMRSAYNADEMRSARAWGKEGCSRGGDGMEREKTESRLKREMRKKTEKRDEKEDRLRIPLASEGDSGTELTQNHKQRQSRECNTRTSGRMHKTDNQNDKSK